jgi:hypothetical protein
MIHRFVSRDLAPIDFDHNLIDIGIDVNFNANGGKIAASWYVSKEGVCECQNFESWGIACRHQCAVSQLLGRIDILGGSIHPFYKYNTSGSTLLLDGPTLLGHIRTSEGGGACRAVSRSFNPAPTEKEQSQQLNKLFFTMLPMALQNTSRFESARNNLLKMCTEFGCDIPEDIDSISVNPVRTDIKQNGALSNATKMPQRLMGVTDNKPNKKRVRMSSSQKSSSQDMVTTPKRKRIRRPKEESSSTSESSSSQVKSSSSQVKSSSSQVTPCIELMEDGREKEQLDR